MVFTPVATLAPSPEQNRDKCGQPRPRSGEQQKAVPLAGRFLDRSAQLAKVKYQMTWAAASFERGWPSGGPPSVPRLAQAVGQDAPSWHRLWDGTPLSVHVKLS